MRYGVTSMTLTKHGTIVAFAYGHGFGRYLFRLKNDGLPPDSVALSFTPAAIISAPTGELYATSYGEGLFVSTDDGKQWSKINADIDPLLMYAPITFAGDGSLILAARTGVYRSTDNGIHWIKSSGIHDSTSVLHLITGKNGKIYAGGFESMLFRTNVLSVSSDSGKTWKTQGMVKSDLDAMSVDGAGNIFIGNRHGVLCVHENGDTASLGLNGIDVNGMGVRSLLVYDSTTIVAGVWGGVYRTVNGGHNWTYLHNGLKSDTANGSFSNPLPFGAYITCGVVNRSGTIFVGTDSAGIFRSLDKGKTWLSAGLGVAKISGLTMDSLGNLFAGTLDNGIYMSGQSGTSWGWQGNEQIQYRKVFSVASVKAFIPKYGIDSSNRVITHIIHAGTNDGVFYRYDTPFDFYYPSGYVSDSVFALTSFGKTGEVYAATVRGEVWLRLGGWWYWVAQGNVGSRVLAMVCDSTEKLYAVGPRGVFRSTDRGRTWYQKNTGISDTNLISIAVTVNGTIFTGSATSGDIYRSTDYGEYWEKFATLSYPVRCLLLDANENMYASAAGRLFMYSARTTLVPSRGNNPPGIFSLYQNYPNPFNPSTTISFSLNRDGMISLTVYDILGRELSILLKEYRTKGMYKIQFNAESLPSGVYLYRLSSDNNVQVRKMVLLK